MMLRQIPKRLFVVLSPDKMDRFTENPFKDMFFGRPELIWPTKELNNSKANSLVFTPNDVVMFEGGTDINPALYKQKRGDSTQKTDFERDKREVTIFEKAKLGGASMIGICRGAQFLCAMSGGSIIQDVSGHNGGSGWHKIRLPNGQNISSTSGHHQMMNPYILPQGDWISYAVAPERLSKKYWDGDNKKVNVLQLWPEWEEQEIVWFPKTKCLAIQGHPEWVQDHKNSPFVRYCRFLVRLLIIDRSENTEGEIQSD